MSGETGKKYSTTEIIFITSICISLDFDGEFGLSKPVCDTTYITYKKEVQTGDYQTYPSVMTVQNHVS